MNTELVEILPVATPPPANGGSAPNSPLPAPCSPSPAPGPPLLAPSSTLPAPGEPPNAFAAFLVYLHLPGKRHLTLVARQTGAGLRTVYRWASEFDWADRVNRHQAALLQQRTQVEAGLQAEALVAWADRSLTIREREWEITDDLLLALQRRLQSTDLDESALAKVARTLALASKIGRLTTGLASRPIEDSPATDPREQEFDAALQSAYGQRLPHPVPAPASPPAAPPPPGNGSN